jgi:hypothetical protein
MAMYSRSYWTECQKLHHNMLEYDSMMCGLTALTHALDSIQAFLSCAWAAILGKSKLYYMASNMRRVKTYVNSAILIAEEYGIDVLKRKRAQEEST